LSQDRLCTAKIAETSFQQDLNARRHIGLFITTIEAVDPPAWSSSSKFILIASAAVLASLNNLRLGFRGGSVWRLAPIGVEQTGKRYEVAWKLAGAAQYSALDHDRQRHYHHKYLSRDGFVPGTDSALQSLETSFQQDLNGDGVLASLRIMIPSGFSLQPATLAAQRHIRIQAGIGAEVITHVATQPHLSRWIFIGDKRRQCRRLLHDAQTATAAPVFIDARRPHTVSTWRSRQHNSARSRDTRTSREQLHITKQDSRNTRPGYRRGGGSTAQIVSNVRSDFRR